MKLLKELRREVKQAKRDRKRAARKRRRYYKGYRDGLRRAMMVVAESPTLHGLALDIQHVPALPAQPHMTFEWSGGEDEAATANPAPSMNLESGVVEVAVESELPDAARYPHGTIARVQSGPDAGVYVKEERVVPGKDTNVVMRERIGEMDESDTAPSMPIAPAGARQGERYRYISPSLKEEIALEIRAEGEAADDMARQGRREDEVGLARACIELSLVREHEYEWEALVDAIARLPGHIAVADIRRAWGDMGEELAEGTGALSAEADKIFAAFPLPGVFSVKRVSVDGDANRVREIVEKARAERHARDKVAIEELNNRQRIKQAEALEAQARAWRKRAEENGYDEDEE